MVRVETNQLTFTQDDVSLKPQEDTVEVTNQFDKAKLQLEKYHEIALQYTQLKNESEYKEAELLILTNWGDALPDHKRPTVGDKEAWIKLQMKEEKQEIGKLGVEKAYLKELYELEKEKYLKEDLDTKEE